MKTQVTNKNKYTLAPDVFLGKTDEQIMTTFFHGFYQMSLAKLGLTIRLVSGEDVSFYQFKKDKKTKKGVPLQLWIDNEGGYYIRVQAGNKEVSFEKIHPETADFINKTFSYVHKAGEFKKVEKAVSKICDNKRKRNGTPYFEKKKDPQAVSLIEKLHALESQQQEFIQGQKYEEAAKNRDEIKKIIKTITRYLAKTYPKRVILKSKFLEEVLLSKRQSAYTIFRSY